ncbi:hypothetical protein [Nostoc sp.]|uniref:hypothetical protein n=1 Tax=Nostoc sp. TaxID=1180 RepID=UPI002FF80218
MSVLKSDAPKLAIALLTAEAAATTGYANAWTINQGTVVIREYNSLNNTMISYFVLIFERFYLCKQKHKLVENVYWA